MITDPRFAPRRTDLPYLRRRSRPRRAAPPTPPAVSKPAQKRVEPAISLERPDRHQISFDRPDRHAISFDRPDRHVAPPSPPAASPPRAAPVPPPPPPRQAASSSSLDLDEPGPAAPAAPPPPMTPRSSPASSSLDLDGPTPLSPPAQAAPSTSSLDLSDVPAPPVLQAPAGPTRRQRTDARVQAGTRMVLTPVDPTVTLTRLQSGIGTLTIEAACSDEVGDLRLGCAYQLASGLSSTVQMTQGERFAPPHARRPVIVGGHVRYERITIDLRQCRDVRRLVVYAFSEGRKPLAWGGTLIVTTFGGARIEVPLETLQGGQVAVLISLYNIGGEFVLRAEMQALNGDVREAARAYGFDRITWLNDRAPVE